MFRDIISQTAPILSAMTILALAMIIVIGPKKLLGKEEEPSSETVE